MTTYQHSRHLSPVAGLAWLKRSFAAIRQQPLPMMCIVLLYTFSMGFLSVLPYAGGVFAALFMPFGTVLLGRGTRLALEGRRPSAALLKDAVAQPGVKHALIRIGLAFGFVLLTSNLLYAWLSADVTAQWKTLDNGRLDWSDAAQHLPWTAFWAMLAVYVPGLMATWFAPLLASEKGMPCGKALFYSFFGCLRNILPIVLLGVIILGGVAATAAALTLLTTVGGLASLESFLIAPAAMFWMVLVYGTYWPMYEALFGGVAGDRP
ncbi:MAG: hypothetical protein HUK26_02725 [Duodenibacillus sp.]|nr:hypothetical protein [Duodenibacillus sp.]